MADNIDTAYLNQVMMSPDGESSNDQRPPLSEAQTPDDLLRATFGVEEVEAATNAAEAPQEPSAEEVAQEAAAEAGSLDELDEDGESDGPPKTRSQKRIRQLLQSKKDMAAKLESMQNQTQQQIMQQQQQFTAWAQNLQQQNQYLQHQLQQMQSKAEQVGEANLSPLEKWERDLSKKMEAQFQRRLGETQKQYDARVAKLEQQLVAKEQAEERKARHQYYTQATEKARKSTFKDLPVDDKIGSTLDNLTITYGAAFGLEPERAAPEVKQMLDQYFNARYKAMTTKNKQSVESNKAKPPVPAKSVAVTELDAGSNYSRDQIRSAGYSDRFEAFADNFKRLRKA